MYKAGHPKVTGPATKKRGVKNEKCLVMLLSERWHRSFCPCKRMIHPIGPAMVNKFPTICK